MKPDRRIIGMFLGRKAAIMNKIMVRVNIQKSVAFFLRWVTKLLVLGLTPTGSGVFEKIKISGFLNPLITYAKLFVVTRGTLILFQFFSLVFFKKKHLIFD